MGAGAVKVVRQAVRPDWRLGGRSDFVAALPVAATARVLTVLLRRRSSGAAVKGERAMTKERLPLTVEDLLENNRLWAEGKVKVDPEFFQRLSKQQSPKYLWIGCSDSRVPANDIVGMDPGELFVHRNVANLVVPSDVNCLSVLQYSLDVLKVENIIVCGHYGCGGIDVAMSCEQLGLIDQWLWPIKALYARHLDELDAYSDPIKKANRLCELNVIEQVNNLIKTTLVQNAWHRGQNLSVYGWVYGLADGLVRDLSVSAVNADRIKPALRWDPL
tara:strand:- start:642 stop:1463 length:822 start_codon:yes stop_codon:yes gene_type:complete